MKIVVSNGGLGNQMFAYAYKLSLQHKKPCSIVLFDMKNSWEEHNGFDLARAFPNIKIGSYIYNRRIRNIYTKYVTKILFTIVKEKKSDYGTYISCDDRNDPIFVVYDGFWQSEKYFYSIKSKIKDVFKFNIHNLNLKSLSLYKRLYSDNVSVSIHFRKGDYSKYPQYFDGTCSLDYYKRALSLMKETYGEINIYVFSDDIEWVMNNMTGVKNVTYVSWNKGNDSWQDMFLMSQCKHNIIANSTFSWWGAWLNDNPHKMVVAPSKWFSTIDARDIIPDTWIKI